MNQNNVEIERKYLLTGVPAFFLKGKLSKQHYIQQHWLPGDKIQERFREIGPAARYENGTYLDVEDSKAVWKRTIKLGSGVERLEFEEDTTEAIFRATSNIAAAEIGKWRHTVVTNEHTWEIDNVYHWRGYGNIWLAEVELESATQEVCIPDSLAPYIIREVTDSKEYTNRSLARPTGSLTDYNLDILALDKKVQVLLPSSYYR